MPHRRKSPPPPPRRRSAADWTALLDALATSGLDIHAFAARHGVTAARLRWWRWHLRRTAHAPDVAHDLRLLPLRLAHDAAPASWELVTPHGQLRVLGPVDPELLLRVIAQMVARS